MRIVICTSVHPVFDKRVFERHALLLRAAGHEVHLIAPNDVPLMERDGVMIHGFPSPRNYAARLSQLGAILRLAVSLKGDLYHLHDPDLLAIGWRIRQALGVPVVYDAHEDFSIDRRVLGLSPRVSRLLSGTVGRVEQFLARRLDAVVCPHRIRLGELRHPDRPGLFLPNYPPHDIFGALPQPAARERSVVYSGVLSRSRGADLLLRAAERMPDVKFLLLAKFMAPGEGQYFQAELDRRKLANVDYRGFVPFKDLPGYLVSAGIGIMPWRRTVQHVRAAQPSKLYEYMACGIPVLASDLPITQEIVARNQCGQLHPADDVDAFVSRAYELLDDSVLAEAMGRRGQQAFESHYSYETAGQTLLAMYDTFALQRAAHTAPNAVSHA